MSCDSLNFDRLQRRDGLRLKRRWWRRPERPCRPERDRLQWLELHALQLVLRANVRQARHGQLVVEPQAFALRGRSLGQRGRPGIVIRDASIQFRLEPTLRFADCGGRLQVLKQLIGQSTWRVRSVARYA